MAKSISVIDPNDPAREKELDAKILAVSNDHDLALVECKGLKADPVPLAASLPKRSSDIMILGFPETSRVGTSLKSTRGIVTALPDPASIDMLMFDAEANHGNSGGPVCNILGEAVGVLTKRFTSDDIYLKYSGGVPSTYAIEFVRAYRPDLRLGEKSGDAEDWPTIDEKVSPAVVRVLHYAETLSFVSSELAADLPGRYANEDLSCVACRGEGHVVCPNSRCNRGEVKVKEFYDEIIAVGNVKKVIKKFRFRKQRCPDCGGRDQVDCPHCRDGRDPSLLR